MIWQETPFTIPLMVASGASIVVGIYVVFRSRNLGDIIGAVLILTNTEYMLTYALELASADLPSKIFWNNLQLVGFAVIPIAWLALTLWYSGRERWLTLRTVAGLALVPALTVLLIFTNETHGLMSTSATVNADAPFVVLEKSYGTWFWFFVMYSYTLILFGVLMLIHILVRSHSLYRWQTVALLLGAVIPWTAATLGVSDVNPFPYLNLIPFAFVLSNVTVAFSLFYLQMGDIVPLAREMIIESMGDAVIVLDMKNQILDTNSSAQHLIGGVFTGQPVGEVWPEWSSQIESGSNEKNEIILDRKNEKRTYDMKISPLMDWRGRTVSRVVVLRDITDRKEAEEKIKQSLKEKEVLLREIHHRVKNNIQIISSLLSLQSKNIKDNKYAEMLRDSQDRIRSMALIHEKLYQSENLADINFNEYIKLLVQSLFRSYGIRRIKLKMEVEDVSLDIDIAIPCGLIINELVSNSLKHAFPHGKEGKITVALRSQDGGIELVVSDNGIGIPDTVDFRTTTSLGLRLVTILAEDQLYGEITLDRSKGTTFQVKFREKGRNP